MTAVNYLDFIVGMVAVLFVFITLLQLYERRCSSGINPPAARRYALRATFSASAAAALFWIAIT
jgi:hypothetical protein